MCRLLGIVSSEPTEFRIVLREAPRSLATLSRQHKDGWGIAIYSESGEWSIHKGVETAEEDPRFHSIAVGSRGRVLVAHIRKKTVGPTSLENTHPFIRGNWIFAHNGTLNDLEYLRRKSSPERLAEIVGQTDSELLFAFVLTHLDKKNLTHAPVSEATDRAIGEIVQEVAALPDIGAFNFLLSNGSICYAHRFGRSLFILERGPHDEVRERRESESTGAVLETQWSQRRHAVFVASEHLTDEPWVELDEGTLIRMDSAPSPSWKKI